MIDKKIVRKLSTYEKLDSKKAGYKISFRNRVRETLKQLQFPVTAWSAFETPLS